MFVSFFRRVQANKTSIFSQPVGPSRIKLDGQQGYNSTYRGHNPTDPFIRPFIEGPITLFKTSRGPLCTIIYISGRVFIANWEETIFCVAASKCKARTTRNFIIDLASTASYVLGTLFLYLVGSSPASQIHIRRRESPPVPPLDKIKSPKTSCTDSYNSYK